MTYKTRGAVPPPSSKRGRVDEFTPAARRRLCQFFASLDWSSYAAAATPLLFVTLTTPAEFWDDEKHVFQSLLRFRRWLIQQDGYEGVVVRKERGARRGMLHYHLIVFGCSWLKADDLRRVWTAALRSSRTVRVEVDQVESADRVAKYLSKYISKAAYDGAPPRRGASPRPAAGHCTHRAGDAPAPEIAGTGLSSSECHSLTEAAGGGLICGSCGVLLDVSNRAAGVCGDCAAEVQRVALSGSGVITGGRWWYVWGDIRKSATVYLKSRDARSIAMQVRRIYRRILRSRRMYALQAGEKKKSGGGWKRAPMSATDAARAVRKWERSGGGAFWRCGLLGRGFSVMASPEVLDKCLAAAVYSCTALVELCVDDGYDAAPCAVAA